MLVLSDGLDATCWFSLMRLMQDADRWSGKRAAGGMSWGHDRRFSILVLGAFSTSVFNTNYPALTLAPTCGVERALWEVFINAGARLLCTSDGVSVIVYVQFSSVGAGMVWGGGFFFSFWDRIWAE
jgi:hypothetical protein